MKCLIADSDSDIFLPLEQSPKYTFSRLSRNEAGNIGGESKQYGSGWSKEGMDKYNDLYRLVREDRKLRGKTFNEDLLLYYKEKRKHKNKQNASDRNKKRKTVAFDDLNPPPEIDEAINITAL